MTRHQVILGLVVLAAAWFTTSAAGQYGGTEDRRDAARPGQDRYPEKGKKQQNDRPKLVPRPVDGRIIRADPTEGILVVGGIMEKEKERGARPGAGGTSGSYDRGSTGTNSQRPPVQGVPLTTYRLRESTVLTLDGRPCTLRDLLSGQYVRVHARPGGEREKKETASRDKPGSTVRGVPGTRTPPMIAERVEAYTKRPKDPVPPRGYPGQRK